MSIIRMSGKKPLTQQQLAYTSRIRSSANQSIDTAQITHQSKILTEATKGEQKRQRNSENKERSAYNQKMVRDALPKFQDDIIKTRRETKNTPRKLNMEDIQLSKTVLQDTKATSYTLPMPPLPPLPVINTQGTKRWAAIIIDVRNRDAAKSRDKTRHTTDIHDKASIQELQGGHNEMKHKPTIMPLSTTQAERVTQSINDTEKGPPGRG